MKMFVGGVFFLYVFVAVAAGERIPQSTVQHGSTALESYFSVQGLVTDV